jgi:hypothetical protein
LILAQDVLLRGAGKEISGLSLELLRKTTACSLASTGAVVAGGHFHVHYHVISLVGNGCGGTGLDLTSGREPWSGTEVIVRQYVEHGAHLAMEVVES